MTKNEEDYLKAIYKLSDLKGDKAKLGTNIIAEELGVTPASANNMIKKLSAKALIDYEKYGSIALTEEGIRLSIVLIRKHRLWETFLHQKLGFNWDEVHEIAEQLEHIQSELLIERLDRFLGYPTIDPHGDAIPDKSGNIQLKHYLKLSDAEVGKSYKIAAVKDNSGDLLKHLAEIGLTLEKRVSILQKRSFDQSLEIELQGKEMSISIKVADNLLVEALKS